MSEQYIHLGYINRELFEAEFGELTTDEIIITEERIQHIKDRHPEDYALFNVYSAQAISSPDMILCDYKNDNTVFMIKRISETNLNIIIRLSLKREHTNYINSVMTFYRIRDKNLKKLENRCKPLYKNE